MSTARRYRNTYAEYVRLEKDCPLKLEYSDGEVFAMAGGTPEHGLLAMQLVRLLSLQLPAGCRIFSSNVKVRIAATDLATYPDLSIVCGPMQRSPDDENALTNPRVIVEVTSPSSEEYDRGDKLSQYKQLTSLDAAVLVSHRKHEVTLVSRQGKTWLESVFRPGDTATIFDGLEFQVTELYAILDAGETGSR
jgi:Uma2 family endonuclease